MRRRLGGLIPGFLRKSDRPPWTTEFMARFERDIVVPGYLRGVAETGPPIVFWMPPLRWPQVFTLELLWAAWLKMAGRQVVFVLCDGVLPYCWYESITGKKKCEQCHDLNRHVMGIGDFVTFTFSDILPAAVLNDLNTATRDAPYDRLRGAKEGTYSIGEKSHHDLCYHLRAEPERLTPSMEETYRSMHASNLISYRIATRVFERHGPAAVVVFNGNSLNTHAAVDAARTAGTRCFTWEDYGVFRDGFVFSQDRPANHTYIPESHWIEARDRKLTRRHIRRLQLFQKRWMGGRVTDTVYHPKPENDRAVLWRDLGLDPHRRTLVAFPNLIWETSCLGRDLGFSGLIDWLFALMEWFAAHEEGRQLVIRIHPAESRALPDRFLTRAGVASRIRERWGESLPENIRIVPSGSHVFSYALADAAEAVAVYTSSLGYELALQGRRVWVAGETHFRGHGFTLDIQDRDHLFRCLDEAKWENRLSRDELNLARRYVYFRYFRQIVRIPFLVRDGTEYRRKPHFSHLRFVQPGNDNTVTVLARHILDGSAVVDVPASKRSELGHFRRR